MDNDENLLSSSFANEIVKLCKDIGIQESEQLKYKWFIDQIAECPLPKDWIREYDPDGQLLYVNLETLQITQNHPNLQNFRQLFNNLIKSQGQKTVFDNEIIHEKKSPQVKDSKQKKFAKNTQPMLDALNPKFDSYELFETKDVEQAKKQFFLISCNKINNDILNEPNFDNSYEILKLFQNHYEGLYGNFLMDVPQAILNTDAYKCAEPYDLVANIFLFNLTVKDSHLFWLPRMYIAMPNPKHWHESMNNYNGKRMYYNSLKGYQLSVKPCYLYIHSLLSKLKLYYAENKSKYEYQKNIGNMYFKDKMGLDYQLDMIELIKEVLGKNTTAIKVNKVEKQNKDETQIKYASIKHEKIIKYEKIMRNPNLKDCHILAIASQLGVNLEKDIHVLGYIEDYLNENIQQNGWVFRQPDFGQFFWINHTVKRAVKDYPLLKEIKDFILFKKIDYDFHQANEKNYKDLGWIKDILGMQSAEGAITLVNNQARRLIERYVPARKKWQDTTYHHYKDIFKNRRMEEEKFSMTKVPTLIEIMKKPYVLEDFTKKFQFELNKKDVFDLLFYCMFDLKHGIRYPKEGAKFLKDGKLIMYYKNALKQLEEMQIASENQKSNPDVRDDYPNSPKRYNPALHQLIDNPEKLLKLAKELKLDNLNFNEIMKDKDFVKFALDFQNKWNDVAEDEDIDHNLSHSQNEIVSEDSNSLILEEGQKIIKKKKNSKNNKKKKVFATKTNVVNNETQKNNSLPNNFNDLHKSSNSINTNQQSSIGSLDKFNFGQSRSKVAITSTKSVAHQIQNKNNVNKKINNASKNPSKSVSNFPVYEGTKGINSIQQSKLIDSKNDNQNVNIKSDLQILNHENLHNENSTQQKLEKIIINEEMNINEIDNKKLISSPQSDAELSQNNDQKITATINISKSNQLNGEDVHLDTFEGIQYNTTDALQDAKKQDILISNYEKIIEKMEIHPEEKKKLQKKLNHLSSNFNKQNFENIKSALQLKIANKKKKELPIIKNKSNFNITSALNDNKNIDTNHSYNNVTHINSINNVRPNKNIKTINNDTYVNNNTDIDNSKGFVDSQKSQIYNFNPSLQNTVTSKINTILNPKSEFAIFPSNRWQESLFAQVKTPSHIQPKATFQKQFLVSNATLPLILNQKIENRAIITNQKQLPLNKPINKYLKQNNLNSSLMKINKNESKNIMSKRRFSMVHEETPKKYLKIKNFSIELEIKERKRLIIKEIIVNNLLKKILKKSLASAFLNYIGFEMQNENNFCIIGKNPLNKEPPAWYLHSFLKNQKKRLQFIQQQFIHLIKPEIFHQIYDDRTKLAEYLAGLVRKGVNFAINEFENQSNT